MARYVAFLRAINVGGRRVTMVRLRELFTEIGCENVDTFLASGNVIFSAPSGTAAALTRRLDAHLTQALGFEVVAFLRTPREITRAVGEAVTPDEDDALHVVFLERAPTGPETTRILALANDVDRFAPADRALYWSCRGGVRASTVSATKLEKAAGMRCTARSISSLRRLLDELAH
jgi:uncharacterized protein (DUF1697 family)